MMQSRCLMSVVILLGACGRKDAAGDEKVAALVDATVSEVTQRPFTETITGLGVVSARSGHLAVLSSAVPARIASVSVALGEHVKRGQQLVEFEASSFRALAQSSNATLDAARRARARASRLVDLGVSARRDLEQADADVAKAVADSVATARTLDLATLRSPIAGVITRLNATLGAMADPSQPLVEVADPSALDVMITVTAADAARLRRGDVVQLQSGADVIGSGSVADIAGAVDSASHGVSVRIGVTHTTRELRLGESITGKITVATRAKAITVPASALVPAEDGFVVFVVDSAGVAHKTDVKVGARTDSLVEILDGLSAGQRVVTRGAFGVEDSAHIGKPRS